MAVKGKNVVNEYTNRFGEVIQGNKTELDFYGKCERSLAKGNILGFTYQTDFELIPPIKDNHGTTTKNTVHILDFMLDDGFDAVAVDTKGGGAFHHDGTAKLKRLLWMHQHPGSKYYMISKASKYVGGYWLDSTPGNDLLTKSKNLYKKLYPWVVKAYQNKDDIKKNGFNKNKNFPYVISNRDERCPKLSPQELHEYYEIFAVCGLFYSYTGKAKKTAKAHKNPFIAEYEASKQFVLEV